jgi:hypothetical protein
MKRCFPPPRSCAEKPRWVAMSEQTSKERLAAFGAALANGGQADGNECKSDSNRGQGVGLHL